MLRFLTLTLLALATSACATRGAITVDCNNFDSFITRLPPSSLVRDIQGDDRELAFYSSAAPPSVMPDALGRSLGEMVERGTAGGPAEGVLLLSGGGQWGAFGAGFLSELHSPQNGLPPRYPTFTTITGVSTGGLQAIFVAVGDDEAFRQLRRSYRPDRESEIVDRNAQALAIVTGSMAGLKPLRARIRSGLCEEGDPRKGCPNIERLAQSGRDVFIGFVEAESGDFFYADAVAIARTAAPGSSAEAIESRRNARDCLAGAALASAAMPVFFQQVRVSGRTYYDGGVRQSVFEAAVASRLAEAQRAKRAAPPDTSSPDAGPALYVVRNGPTSARPDPGPNQKADAVTNALRAEAIIVNELEVGSIAELRLAHPDGPIWLVTADGYDREHVVPATAGSGEERVPGCQKPDEIMFDPQFMRCIMDFGRSKAARPAPWKALRPLAVEAQAGAAQ